MSSLFDLKAWMQPHLTRVEVALADGIAKPSPADLGDAMRYAVLDGGKRLRPLLVLATAGLMVRFSKLPPVALLMLAVMLGVTLRAPDSARPEPGKLHIALGEPGALLPQYRAIALSIVGASWLWAIGTITHFMLGMLGDHGGGPGPVGGQGDVVGVVVQDAADLAVVVAQAVGQAVGGVGRVADHDQLGHHRVGRAVARVDVHGAEGRFGLKHGDEVALDDVADGGGAHGVKS